MKLPSKIARFALLVSLAIVAPVRAAWQNYQEATTILGRTILPSPGRFFMPQDIAVNPASGKVYVVDGGYNRVLRFSSAAALGNGQPAEAVFGQPHLNSGEPGLGAAVLRGPQSAAVDSAGRLWVTDTENHRILRWDNADAAASGAAAAQVLGQPNFTSRNAATSQTGLWRPGGLTVDSQDRLWIADYFNHRVLRYDNPSTKGNGGAADGVLGQPHFTSSDWGASAIRFNSPYDLAVDAQGRLWVADFLNGRVLRFDSPASQNQPAADGVLGQPDFTTISTGNGPAKTNRAITLALAPSGSLFVMDTQNRRILRWDNAAAKANGAAADGVLGRLGLDGNAATPAMPATVSTNLRGLAVDSAGRLWGVDRELERVMRWDNAVAKPNGAAADGVIGQPDTNSTVNTADYALGPRAARSGLEDPVSKKFFLADAGRVLRYASRSAAESGAAPEAALGRPYLAEPGNEDASETILVSSAGLAMDSSGKLWVSDSDADRVVAFPDAATAPTGATMSVVLGQANFTDSSPALSQTRMSSPRGLAIDPAGNLYVADYANNRVLRFDNIVAKVTGAPADAVIGQADFISASSSGNVALLEKPQGICCDSAGRLWVADSANYRVARYDAPHLLSSLVPPSSTLGYPSGVAADSMARPTGVAIDAGGRLWVADAGYNRLLRFDNAASKPPLSNADGVLCSPALDTFLESSRTRRACSAAEGVFVDLAGNLWVADETNRRVLKFVPSPSAVIISSGLNASKQFTLTFQGQANIPYTVMSSIDLQTWTPEATFTLGAPGTQVFTDTKGGSRRFFRVEEP